jgi:peptidoglycan/LPS O-acetylase OafA/YrhL
MGHSRPHRGDIQGLRAVAVLLVALNHAGVGILRGGFVGVDVFFVLSGFLITGILVCEAQTKGAVSLVGFYVRRARRILPAAALTLLATELAAFFLLNFVRAREVVWDSLFAATFGANFRFAEQGTDYFAQAQPPSPVLHFWSLAVEEQFYLVWPALLVIVLFGAAAVTRGPSQVGMWHRRRLGLVVVAVGCASLVWSVYLTAAQPVVAYFSPLTRAWELALGAALAVWAPALVRMSPRSRLVAGWSGLVTIAATAIVFSERTPFPGYSALFPTIGTAFVICAGITAGPSRLAVGQLLALPPLRFIGDRSYAFYLWHWPVLIIAGQYSGYDLSLGVNLLLLFGAFVLSIASYALFENPIRRAKWSGARSSVVFGASVAVLFVAAVLSLRGIDIREARFNGPAATEPLVIAAVPVAKHISTFGSTLPAVVASVRAARQGEPIPTGLTPRVGDLRNEALPYSLPGRCVPVAASSQSSSDICRIGKTASSRSIVVIGDSHAQMWMPAIVRMAERDGWVVIPLLRPGCTPDTWVDERGLAACRPWYRWATRQVRLLRPNVTIVGGAVGGYGGAVARAAENGMLAMARATKAPSGKVLVVGDPEGLRRNPTDCLLTRHATMADCTTTWPPISLRPYNNIAAGSRKLGMRFLDTRGWFCFERECPTVIGRTIAYRDNHHITAAYALRLTNPFTAAFRVAIRTH